MVPPVGLEPTHLAVPDFESGASTNSTTGAWGVPINPPDARLLDAAKRPPAHAFLARVAAAFLAEAERSAAGRGAAALPPSLPPL